MRLDKTSSARGARRPPLPVDRSNQQLVRAGIVALVAVAAACACTTPAFAQEAPAGAELIMSDWILGAFLVFFGSGLIVFLVAARLGAFRNLEGAKYYLLTLEEKDYYTPDWAKDDSHDALR